MYSPLGELLLKFSFEDHMSYDDHVIGCKFWGRGVVILTDHLMFYSALIPETSLGSGSGSGGGALSTGGSSSSSGGRGPSIKELANANLGLPPEFWVVEPPEVIDQDCGPGAHPMVLLGLPDGRLCAVREGGCYVNDNEILRSAANILFSPNGKFAVVSIPRRLMVMSADLTHAMTSFETEWAEGPEQLGWCGSDSVVAVNAGELRVYSPNGETIVFEYDLPVRVFTECDGLRVVSAESSEFLELVPDVTERVFNLDSTDPGSLLYAAVEYYDAKDPRADTTLREIMGELAGAVETCVEAAAMEFGTKAQRTLLRAATLGKSFVDGYRADRFVEMCKTLRVLNAVRDFRVGIPITYKEYSQLTLEGLVSRLLALNRHLLALRICESMGGAYVQHVITHWARAKVRTAQGDDAAVGEQILAMLRGRVGIPYAQIAAAAFRAGRRELAKQLVDYEPHPAEQIPLLMDMDLKDLALEKALASGDCDLVYIVLLNLLDTQDPGWIDSVKARPAALDMLLLYLRAKDPEMYVKILQTLDLNQQLAFYHARSACLAKSFDDAVQGFKLVQEDYARASKDKNYLPTRLTEDHIKLLIRQHELEKSIRQPLFGLPLADTIKKLLTLKDTKNAERLRSDFKVSDKMWWWLRLDVIDKSKDSLRFADLEKLSKERKNPIGFIPFAQLCIRAKAMEEAYKYITQIPSAADKAPLLALTGRAREGADVAFKAKELFALQKVLD